ncbi:hypothetical protein [Sebaldella sp. S0638]|uniref:hypothetical protein n=1 Tax=Sebaldella sp. S0638 TaxID=2957809 RepID=UPI00209EA74B|nr:hypothetical protein [Sebaldella sp. S0638]MCP1226466.1 hypothetical protein [Sebaldella sp. S0638]
MREAVQLWTIKPLKKGDRVSITSLSENREYIGVVKEILLQQLVNEDSWINDVIVEEVK